MSSCPHAPFTLATRVLRALALSLVLAVPMPVGAAGTLDQEQATTAGVFSVHGDDLLAQTFTAGLSGRLDQVDLRLARPLHDAGSAADLIVQLRDVSVPSGLPGSTVLASATVSDPGVTDSTTWVPVTFSPAATVSAGTQYALVLQAPNAAASVSYLWGTTAQDVPADFYPGGRLFYSDNAGASWSNAVGPSFRLFDGTFKTYVSPILSAGGGGPVNNGIVNVVEAGQAIPVTWHLATTGGACAGGAPTNEIETYVGGSGVRYLANGNRQLNWAMSKGFVRPS